ncbi:DUF6233 domain-containing protein [Streptomyces sp. NPDC006283]|uniref:DUF6233 domain-containing protein n=1 Tax=Streptomyces sp. NPDC006283 TaxID=3156741 RepID=UPI0033A8ABDC
MRDSAVVMNQEEGEGEGTSGPPSIFVVLPDGQEVRARLHARRQEKDGWRYQVGIQLWQGAANGDVGAAEQRAWVSPAQARPIPGVSYRDVPTYRPSPAGGPPQKSRPAWTLLHVIGCTPSDQTLNQEQALAALSQPRAAACTECDAARSLTPEQPSAPLAPRTHAGELRSKASRRAVRGGGWDLNPTKPTDFESLTG